MTGTEYRDTLVYIPASVHHHHHHHIHFNEDSQNNGHSRGHSQQKPRHHHLHHRHHHHPHQIIKEERGHSEFKQYHRDKFHGHKGDTSSVSCLVCGKLYGHISTLTKHLWEHTPKWQMSKDTPIPKHQQEQLLEAAAILVDMMKANHRILGHPLSPSPTPSPLLKAESTSSMSSVPLLAQSPLSSSLRSVRRPAESMSPPTRKVKKDVRFRNRRLSSSAAYRKKERKLPTISEEGVVVPDSPLEEE